jgi:scyllo-inositol 2-dehydrogenase (NADP+)
VLFGIPEAISADIRVERDGAVTDDAFDVTLRYPGRRALLRGSMLAITPGPTLALHGTGGSFVKYGLDPQEAALRSGHTPDEPDWDVEPPEHYGTLTTAEGARAIPTVPSSFTRYYENVRDAILGKAPLAVPPERALEVMRGLELAVESSRKGCVVPWPASH